jgi:16S rRNA (uracil1498-N3)-methyltransferase
MHRFYLPPQACQGPILTLTGSEAHHALAVLRVRAGDQVTVLDGAGHEYCCEVGETARGSVALHARARRVLPGPRSRLTLVQAVTKHRSMDLIVQKATELGAHRIVPVLAERSVVRVSPAEAPRKANQWRAVALEALKQCGAPWLPAIEPPVPAVTFLARGERFDLALLASLQPGSRHPREWLDDYQRTRGRPPDEVAVWVGPEGDFAPAELAAISSHGALPITLGPHVLRSETAALYCLSVLSYEFQR